MTASEPAVFLFFSSASADPLFSDLYCPAFFSAEFDFVSSASSDGKMIVFQNGSQNDQQNKKHQYGNNNENNFDNIQYPMNSLIH